MEYLKQENLELREEVLALQAKVERLTALVENLVAAQIDPPKGEGFRKEWSAQKLTSSDSTKRGKTAPLKRKEPEVGAIIHGNPGRKGYQHQQVTTATKQPLLQHQHQGNQQAAQRNQKPKKDKQPFDPIPMTYADLFPILLQRNLIQTKALLRVPATLPWWYKPESNCAFHQGAPGHGIENCFALKAEVQGLIRSNVLTFKEGTSTEVIVACTDEVPNFEEFLVSPHQQPWMEKVRHIDPIPITYSQLWPYLVHNSLVTPRTTRPMKYPFPTWYNPETKCEFHDGAKGHSIEECKAFKEEVQQLIDNKKLIFKDKTPIKITDADASKTLSITDKDVKGIRSSISPFKDARRSVEKGTAEGWGQVPELPENKDRKGLGFSLSGPMHKDTHLFRLKLNDQNLQCEANPQPAAQHNQQPSFDPIPMKYGELLPLLLQRNLVQTRPQPAIPTILPWWYKLDDHCVFHQGAPGHNVENCFPLKFAVQKLIRDKEVTFGDTSPTLG